MDPELEEKVRARAQLQWEAEGRPEGRAAEHWAQAVAEVEVQQNTPQQGASLQSRVNELYDLIQAALLRKEDILRTPQVQEELGQWINILSYLFDRVRRSDTSTVSNTIESDKATTTKVKNKKSERVEPGDVIKRAGIAIRTLLSNGGASITVVQGIRHEVYNDLHRCGGPFASRIVDYTGGSPSMIVVWGIVLTSLVALVSLVIARSLFDLWNWSPLLLHPKVILGIAVPAFLGAVISILARLDQFESRRGVDPKLLFMTAFFKPYVGMVTGLFIVSALAVGIVNVADVPLMASQAEQPSGSQPDPAANLAKPAPSTPPQEADVALPALSPEQGDANWPPHKAIYFFYVVGFLAGFSERFTRDFVGRAEGRFGTRQGSGSATDGPGL